MPQNFEKTDDFDLNRLTVKRPTMGDDIPVFLWKLIRIVGFHRVLEEETPVISYFMGKQIGKMVKVGNIKELQKKLTDLKIGKISFPVNSANRVHMEISECLTCYGINPPLGKAVCQLETGIVAGILEGMYSGRKVIGEETKCIGGLGHDVCLMEYKII